MLSDDEKKAAALASEADAKELLEKGDLYRTYKIPDFTTNDTTPPLRDHTHNPTRKRAGTFWMETLGPKYPGNFPFGDDNANYTVFRNVKDYGAKGDGTTDDTFAIMIAMYMGGRCGSDCGGTTVKGATVYFPSGENCRVSFISWM